MTRRVAALLALLGYHLSRYRFLFIRLDELALGLLLFTPAYYLGWQSWRTGLRPWQIALSAACLLVLPVFWLVHRQRYTLFEPAPISREPATPLRDEERIRLRGTGYFEVSGMRRYFISAPAVIWRTELQDYILMARINVVEIPLLIAPSEEQGMWYVFVNAHEWVEATPGTLSFGLSSLPTLVVVYQTPEKAREFVYLSFEHADDLRRVLAEFERLELCPSSPLNL